MFAILTNFAQYLSDMIPVNLDMNLCLELCIVTPLNGHCYKLWRHERDKSHSVIMWCTPPATTPSVLISQQVKVFLWHGLWQKAHVWSTPWGHQVILTQLANFYESYIRCLKMYLSGLVNIRSFFHGKNAPGGMMTFKNNLELTRVLSRYLKLYHDSNGKMIHSVTLTLSAEWWISIHVFRSSGCWLRWRLWSSFPQLLPSATPIDTHLFYTRYHKCVWVIWPVATIPSVVP